jgi:hypothetical protein
MHKIILFPLALICTILFFPTDCFAYLNTTSSGDSILTHVGSWNWGPCYTSCGCTGKYIFIGNGSLVQTVDISNVDSINIVSEYNTGSIVFDIEYRDSMLFVCCGKFLILDASNPLSLRPLGQYNSIFAEQVVVTDTFAYVVLKPVGPPGLLAQGNISPDAKSLQSSAAPILLVIDYTDPQHLIRRSGTAMAADYPVHIAVSKDRIVYGSGWNYGCMSIIDARATDSLSHHDLLIPCTELAIRDTILYGFFPYFAAWSISDPFNPVLLDSVQFSDFSRQQGMVINNNYVISSSDSGMKVFDISDPYNLHLRKSYKFGRAVGLNNLTDMSIGYSLNSGFSIIDITNVDSAYSRSYFPTSGWVSDIAIKDHYAYVACGGSGLATLDLSDPLHPQRVSIYSPNVPIGAVVIDSNRAYITGAGIWTVDISNPATPVLLSHTPTVSGENLVIQNHKMYGCGNYFSAYDLGDSSQPILISNFSLGFTSGQFVILDTLAVIAANDSLVFLDISDPANISRLAALPIGVISLIKDDKYIYACTYDSLIIYNQHYPLIVQSTIGIPMYGYLAKENNFLYIAEFQADQLDCIDVSVPSSPVYLGGVYSEGRLPLGIMGKYIYSCDALSGIDIFTNNFITSVVTPRVNKAKVVSISQNYPNPWNPSTTIHFELPHESHVVLQLFNVLGEKVRTIVDESRPAGAYDVSLDGSGLASGVYYYRITAGVYTQTRKMVLVR